MTDAEAQQYRTERWLKYVRNDERAMGILLEEDGPPTTVAFLAQQMSEKLLKAVLAYHDAEVPKIHSLGELILTVRAYASGFTQLDADATLLDECYIEGRYPGDYPDISQQQSIQAAAAAMRFKDAVLKEVGAIDSHD